MPAKGGPKIYLVDDCVASFASKRNSAFKCKYSNEVWKAAAREKDRTKVKESVKQGLRPPALDPAFVTDRGRPSAARLRPSDCSNQRGFYILFQSCLMKHE